MRSALILLLLGCGQSIDGPQTPTEAEAEAPSESPAQNIAGDFEVELPMVLGTRRVPIEVDIAEDGLGNEIRAPSPIAIDIEAERWAGRALDPVLLIDERVFHHYRHPGPGLIRYVLADEAWLDEAMEMAIRYQDPDGRGDEAIPLPLPPRLDP